MGRIPDDWDGETFAPGYGPDDEPPMRKIKPPFPDARPWLRRSPGTLHDPERVENAIFPDNESGS